jgi:NADPH2 dehydrogenase
MAVPAPTGYPRVASYHSSSQVAARLRQLGFDLPCDDSVQTAPHSPLARPLDVELESGVFRLANRFATQPMEGWDGESDGRPSPLTVRRWRNFGSSGAALIWGGEAVAVLPEARANPNQLLLNAANVKAIANLRTELLKAHQERFGGASRPLIGLQLTHSGRFSRPDGPPAPLVAARDPLLDARFEGYALRVIQDDELPRIVAAFASAARLAESAGFDFVDLKHCHGYLGHEFLGAGSRDGDYGGAFENRTRLLRELIAAVREHAPGLTLGVRLSAFDMAASPDEMRTELPPAEKSRQGSARAAFGPLLAGEATAKLEEPIRLVRMLRDSGVRLLNITAGSPYYCAHIQRPALFPPIDAVSPPEDPLAGAARLQIAARVLRNVLAGDRAAAAAADTPQSDQATGVGTTVVSSGWSYFQDYLPHFAQAAVRDGWCDCVGVGRMALAYPELPADVLQRGVLDRRRICRTFSDCTNAPRAGMVSGCYPLDPFYRARPERERLEQIKKQLRSRQEVDA